jgi:hypothetical protein
VVVVGVAGMDLLVRAMHAKCIWCGGNSCTCFDTDEEYESEGRMREEQANELARRALPCPFCGERLVVKSSDQGHWVAHEDEPGPCFLSFVQLIDVTDLDGWNTRAGEERVP